MTNNEVKRAIPPLEDMRLLDVALDYREKAEAEIARLKGELTDAAFAIADTSRRMYRVAAQRDALQLQLDIERAGAVEMARVIAGLRQGIKELIGAYVVASEMTSKHDMVRDGLSWNAMRDAHLAMLKACETWEPSATQEAK